MLRHHGFHQSILFCRTSLTDCIAQRWCLLFWASVVIVLILSPSLLCRGYTYWSRWGGSRFEQFLQKLTIFSWKRQARWFFRRFWLLSHVYRSCLVEFGVAWVRTAACPATLRSCGHSFLCLSVLRGVDIVSQLTFSLHSLWVWWFEVGFRHGHWQIEVFMGRKLGRSLCIKSGLLALHCLLSEFHLACFEVERLSAFSASVLFVDDCFYQILRTTFRAIRLTLLKLLHFLIFDHIQLLQDCNLFGHFLHL